MDFLMCSPQLTRNQKMSWVKSTDPILVNLAPVGVAASATTQRR
jgi:hypothetical protein